MDEARKRTETSASLHARLYLPKTGRTSKINARPAGGRRYCRIFKNLYPRTQISMKTPFARFSSARASRMSVARVGRENKDKNHSPCSNFAPPRAVVCPHDNAIGRLALTRVETSQFLGLSPALFQALETVGWFGKWDWSRVWDACTKAFQWKGNRGFLEKRKYGSNSFIGEPSRKDGFSDADLVDGNMLPFSRAIIRSPQS